MLIEVIEKLLADKTTVGILYSARAVMRDFCFHKLAAL